ncbi:MAG: exopolyphosphatase [Pseudomonadota bacterium]
MAVIDVGSNSVRLVVFDGHARSPAYFFNEKVLCGLGKGMTETGRLNPEGRRRALATLRRFAALAERLKVNALVAVATAAVRLAKDGAAFIAEVEHETGLRVRVASGTDEARLAGQGVLLGDPQAAGVVADIGGSSMELARIRKGRVEAGATTLLGPLALRSSGLSNAALNRHIGKSLATAWASVAEGFENGATQLFLVGGAWRAMGRVHMQRTRYPLMVLHDYTIPPDALLEVAHWVIQHGPADIVSATGISSSRAELLGLNARVLIALITALGPETVTLSSYGMREGLLWELMTPRARARDPLLEACRYLETRRARFPGFGSALFAWLGSVLAIQDRRLARLAEAACYLHDVNWRSHPDYRAQIGFETLTRAAIGGIDHRGRVFVGLALHHRYRSSGTGKLPHALIDLLSPDERVLAERLGRAMRLGAMVSGSAPGGLDLAPLTRSEGQLQLTLSSGMRDLAGEVVEKRLAALARSLGLSHSLIEV